MLPPRMKVAVFGHSHAGCRLANGMSAAGHSVEKLEEIAHLGQYDALIIAVGESGLARATALLADSVRRGQVVIHTCLALGVQVLDDLETRGAVVAAVAPVGDKRWVVTTVDELGATIAELVLGEMGATGIEKTDAERGPLAARVAYAQMAGAIAEAAHRDVQKLMDEDTVVPLLLDNTEAMSAYKYVKGPGLRRAFVEAARRFGEIKQDQSLEIWAFQEENR